MKNYEKISSPRSGFCIIAGKVVSDIHIEGANSLDISLLNKGMFTFQIRNESGIHTGRFVKL